jgi:hypothetical protein
MSTVHGNERSVGYETLQALGTLATLGDELAEALSLYWSTAENILDGGSVQLRAPRPEYFAIESNLFSALFLYSYLQVGVVRPRRVFYAAVNQCLRGMVTGCDNLLDDEYKQTLDTDLPEEGIRFRSVLDIMVSDRALFNLLIDSHQRGELSADEVRSASSASLHGLLSSGVQEAGEEAGIKDRLMPDEVLRAVHHYKTGLLFQCPWSLPAVLEDIDPETLDRTTQALYQLGMGCQILDDMVDLASDLRMRRHNYAASLICHDTDPGEHARLQDWLQELPASEADADLLLVFPRARQRAVTIARGYLETGTRDLFMAEHLELAQPVVELLIERIGADRFMFDAVT